MSGVLSSPVKTDHINVDNKIEPQRNSRILSGVPWSESYRTSADAVTESKAVTVVSVPETDILDSSYSDDDHDWRFQSDRIVAVVKLHCNFQTLTNFNVCTVCCKLSGAKR
ncbi:hypothetical protein AB6A40_008554 [Gnathostoma spinigerum]|uniref:Uncharacterized protein n=1 Tax=Gnathostoma spinigerum TaxID=75299 RepID=A0ABD6EPE2_9BILA